MQQASATKQDEQESSEDGKLLYRKPSVEEGAKAWELVKDSGVLDLNSAYSYLMLFDLFRDTCCVAVEGGELVGFVSAFRKPSEPAALFVWQIGVSAKMRGRGVGKELLKQLLQREAYADIQYVEATISPGNVPSSKLFRSMAGELGAECDIRDYYASELFPGDGHHDDERLYRIGPFRLHETTWRLQLEEAGE
ncbi:diaminobutyrate acetyltransferase [Paenibacillus sp. J5C_2022]|uniref:diaminobutyrate acetyltransferase n=1 Tax=Paenibacillus sp. J5C2022 TaxID=2977129 RepID=UPI0021D14D68|nr:diaminobutyrate acetyltransferase [Paenibacillus sp. J5C2022]MCU6708133.1 diaminobutyrate acetyltransferase [Paenibacillus sp. J5C2022]